MNNNKIKLCGEELGKVGIALLVEPYGDMNVVERYGIDNFFGTFDASAKNIEEMIELINVNRRQHIGQMTRIVGEINKDNENEDLIRFYVYCED